MRREFLRSLRVSLIPYVLTTVAAFPPSIGAQSPDLQQKIEDVKEAAARNKQALAQYTWAEQDTISLKGEQKKQDTFKCVSVPMVNRKRHL